MKSSHSLVRGNLHLNLVIHSGKVKFRDQCSSCYQAIVYLLLLFCFTFTPYDLCAISSHSLQSILNTHLRQKKHNIIHYSSLIHYYTHLISCKTLSSNGTMYQKKFNCGSKMMKIYLHIILNFLSYFSWVVIGIIKTWPGIICFIK